MKEKVCPLPGAELSDVQFTIPMVGMVESLNISVSCALSLRSVVERMKLELGNSFFLEASERKDWFLAG